jgi:anti-anti-sigma factor
MTIRLRGEIDVFTAAASAARLRRAVDQRPDLLAVDCSDVTFMDSAGVDVLDEMRVRLHALGGRLIVRHATPQVRQVLELVTDWAAD